MYGNRKPYPPEFRKEAVNLVKTSGKSIRSVADSLGIPFESLRVWVKRKRQIAPTLSVASPHGRILLD